MKKTIALITLIAGTLLAQPYKSLEINNEWQQLQSLPELIVMQGGAIQLYVVPLQDNEYLNLTGMTARLEARESLTETNYYTASSLWTSNDIHTINIPLNSEQTGDVLTNYLYSIILEKNSADYVLGTGSYSVVQSTFTGAGTILNGCVNAVSTNDFIVATNSIIIMIETLPTFGEVTNIVEYLIDEIPTLNSTYVTTTNSYTYDIGTTQKFDQAYVLTNYVMNVTTSSTWLIENADLGEGVVAPSEIEYLGYTFDGEYLLDWNTILTIDLFYEGTQYAQISAVTFGDTSSNHFTDGTYSLDLIAQISTNEVYSYYSLNDIPDDIQAVKDLIVAPDLSDYAKTTEAQEFDGVQTFKDGLVSENIHISTDGNGIIAFDMINDVAYNDTFIGTDGNEYYFYIDDGLAQIRVGNVISEGMTINGNDVATDAYVDDAISTLGGADYFSAVTNVSGTIINLSTNQIAYSVNLTNDTTFIFDSSVSNVIGALMLSVDIDEVYDITWSNAVLARNIEYATNTIYNFSAFMDSETWNIIPISGRSK